MSPPAAVQQKEETTEELMRSIEEDCAQYCNAGKSLLRYSERLAAKLERLRKRIPHTEWLPTVSKLGLHPRTVQRWLRRIKEPEIDANATLAHLDDALSSYMEPISEENKSEPPPVAVESWKVTCRDCRMKGFHDKKKNKDCKICRKLRKKTKGTTAPKREAGWEPPKPEEQLLEKAAKMRETFIEVVVRQSRLRSAQEIVVNSAKNHLKCFYSDLEKIVRAQPKPAPAPRKAKCDRCQGDILWVLTENGAWFALDADQGGGSFELIENRPVRVEWTVDGDYSRCYRSHFGHCKPEGSK
jgi:hypothetical protein